MDVNIAGDMLVANRADITVESPPTLLRRWMPGNRLSRSAGIHGGCYELFGNETNPCSPGHEGKRVAVEKIGASPDSYFWIASLLAYVGMDPRDDIRWVEGRPTPRRCHCSSRERRMPSSGFRRNHRRYERRRSDMSSSTPHRTDHGSNTIAA